VSGTEVLVSVAFMTPFDLPAGHYFFVPQVGVSTANGNFYWLSGTRPLVTPGTPFAPDLDPNWLRLGTDIVGGATPPTFNGAFTLTGETVPEPATWGLVPLGAAVLLLFRRRPLNRSSQSIPAWLFGLHQPRRCDAASAAASFVHSDVFLIQTLL
jgi:hypothetical protein